ncbi:MAG: A24 family peptidase [Armatimonadota bacterium]|jgi:prepilin peptidase CpaA
MDHVLIGASVLLVLIAAYTDIRWGKIFNAITVPFALLGLTLNTVGGGLEGLLLSLGGIGAGFALWLVSNFLGRIMGGGDIKLLMALGALMGAGFMLWTFAIGAIAGGVMAVAISLRRGLLGKVVRQMGTSLYMRAKFSEPMEITDGAGEVRLPYAIALGLGALITIGMRLWTEQGI